MQASKRTAIIGDIGGTHARFAICDIDELSVSHFAVFQTAMFASLPEAVANYLESIPDNPDIAGFAIADPVTGDRMGVENSSWSFSADEVKAACGADRVHFVNNFEALAHSLPYLIAHDRCQINPGEPVDGAPMIVLGTGGEFGSAMLIEAFGKRISIAGHAGHAAFAASNDREMVILKKVAGNFGYAPIQSILSGRGIESTIRIGTPGPAGIKRLISFASRFGVGANAMIVKKYGFSLTNLMGSAGPDKFVSDLAALFDADPSVGAVKLHMYTFGGLEATATWARDFIAK